MSLDLHLCNIRSDQTVNANGRLFVLRCKDDGGICLKFNLLKASVNFSSPQWERDREGNRKNIVHNDLLYVTQQWFPSILLDLKGNQRM